ncbi:MAG: molybdate ABC transporter substrate-binding protein [Eubacteriales bacterium]|jgi:molybdate transport system substrate-binding protein
MKNKKAMALVMACVTALSLAACGSTSSTSSSASSASETETASSSSIAASSSGTTAASSETATVADSSASVETASAEDTSGEPVEIQVFIAASLNNVMTEIAEKYNETHPEVTITYNADSSGKLMQQIEEGYTCDLFFSAAQKQMDELEENGFVVDGTRKNVVNNQLVVITLKDSGTKVTGLENLGDASSIALADGSVPVGKYTRTALMNLGILPETDDPSQYTTEEVSEALGGVEISEQSNVSKVLQAVTEGSCEVGTTYYSDTYGHEDDIEILETVSYDLTGDVIYPIAQITNEEATDAETAAAADFEEYVTSDEAKEIFQKYYFDTDVE